MLDFHSIRTNGINSTDSRTDGGSDGRANGLMDGWSDGCVDGRIQTPTDGKRKEEEAAGERHHCDGREDGRVYEWLKERVNERRNGWTVGPAYEGNGGLCKMIILSLILNKIFRISRISFRHSR